ncbi:MAG: sortase [Patescibacteria group bacterium]|jgi:LPXTG-site transpeptidase (sortase) family protein
MASKKSGVIYQASSEKEPLPKNTVFRFVGKVSLGAAVVAVGVLFTLFSLTQVSVVMQRIGTVLPTYSFDSHAESALPNVSPVPTPDPASLPFSLEIPAIGLQASVVPNVDAGDSKIYTEALKKGVAHALNSAFPGQGKMVFIFGHSTDYPWNIATYNALFIEIKELNKGDAVFLRLGDQIFSYTVREKRVVAPKDLSLVDQLKDQDVLILQTCYPPGTTWQRLLVIAEPINT